MNVNSFMCIQFKCLRPYQSGGHVPLFRTHLTHGSEAPERPPHCAYADKGDLQKLHCGYDPGRGFIMTTFSPRNTASSKSCVTNNMVVRLFCQMSSSASCMCVRVKASSAPKGSSRQDLGSRNNALAIATRLAIPPDNSFGYAFSNPFRRTSSISSWT